MERQQIGAKDKERLVASYLEGQDYMKFAAFLGIKENTAYRIIHRAIKRNGIVIVPRGGKRYEKVDDDMRRMVETLIEENPCLTLKAINENLKLRLPEKPHVSDRTIGNMCDGLLYTVKKLSLIPANRNSLLSKQERIIYADWYLQEAVLSPHVVFVDESGYNIWTCRSQGRSKRGEPAAKVVCNQRGQNFTLMLAISSQIGVVHYSFSQATVAKPVFQQFLHDVIGKIPLSAAGGQSFVIMDNATIHKDVVSNRPDVSVKYLPPYSSPLNPIEEAFSSWKAVVKQTLSEPSIQAQVMDKDIAGELGFSLHQMRQLYLQHVGTECLSTLTPEKCQRFVNHSINFLYRCMNSEDI